MADQAAPIATDLSDGRKCRSGRPAEPERSNAPVASDTFAPLQSARPPEMRQPPPPDEEIGGGRVDEGGAPPHPSQDRMCRFPASGSSWESLARGGVGDTIR